MIALSASRARNFEECPWAYRETRIRKALTLPADPLDFGTLIHAAIQRYVDHLIETKQEFAPQDVPIAWGAFVAAQERPIPERMYHELHGLLETFAASFRLDLDRVWKTEADLAVDSDRNPTGFFDSNARVRGKCDLVLTDGLDAWVDDWKSARFVLRDADIAEDLQAQTYAMLVLALLPDVSAVTVRFRYIRYNYIAQATFSRRDADLTWARWQEIGARVDAAHEALTDEKAWAPTPGWACGNCAVVLRCPLAVAEQAPKVGLVTDEEQATDAARRILVLEAAAKALKDGLRKRVESSGPVSTNGMTFDLYKEESYEYDTNRVIGFAKKHFIEPSTVLKVDTEALKRIGKKEKPFFLDVCGIREDKCRLAFKAKKAKPETEAPETTTDAGSSPQGGQA